MRPLVHIINGPNLNLIGEREPEIYGQENLQDYIEKLSQEFSQISLQQFQSNNEGEIIDYIQSIPKTVAGIIINAGAFTHTSIGIPDALRLFRCPIVEVHISDIDNREEYRKISYIHDLAWSHIIGLGIYGYKVALIRIYELNNFKMID